MALDLETRTQMGWFVLGTTVLAVSVLGAPVAAQTEDRISAGSGTLYLGTYPQHITVVDEATEQVVDQIPVSIGVPRSLTLSEDLSRFYMIDSTFEKFEVIDVARRETLNTFTLSDENRRARIRSYRVHPDGRHVVLVVATATKLIDRFEVEPPQLLLYDLEQDEVVRELDWPTGKRYGLSRMFSQMLFSPQGEYLYFFDRDVLVLETENFREVDRWAISKPLEDGLGRLTLDFSTDLINEEPGFFTGLFRVRDDVQNRDLMGVARINLAEKEVDFYTLGPSAQVSFALAPGRRKAYASPKRSGTTNSGRSTSRGVGSRVNSRSRGAHAWTCTSAPTDGCCISHRRATRLTCTTRSRSRTCAGSRSMGIRRPT